MLTIGEQQAEKSHGHIVDDGVGLVFGVSNVHVSVDCLV